MPLSSTAGEAWRNLCTGTARALTSALALAGSLGVLIWADVGSAASLANKAHSYVDAGSSTYVIVSEGGIDGAACEYLISSGYVNAAGALRRGDEIRLRVLPSNPVSAYELTPGLLQLIDVKPSHPGVAGVLLSSVLADAVAPVLNQPTRSGTSAQPPVVVAPLLALGTYSWPDDGRPTQLQYAVLGAVQPTGSFDECWVRSLDPNVDPTFLLRSTLVRAPNNPSDAQISQLNPRLGESLTVASEFASRPTRLAWLASLAFGAFLAAASIWLRRLELASARELGVSTTSQLAQTLLETLAWAIIGTVLATPLLLARAASSASEDRMAMVAVATPILLAGIIGSIVGSLLTAVLVRRRPVTAYLRTR